MLLTALLDVNSLSQLTEAQLHTLESDFNSKMAVEVLDNAPLKATLLQFANLRLASLLEPPSKG